MAGLTIGRAERLLLVGMTGSGKTTLARALLMQRPHSVVIDPKHTFDPAKLPGATLYTDLGKLFKHSKPGAAVYRPDLDEASAGCPDVFNWAMAQGNRVVYVDEVIALVPRSATPPAAYARAIQMGRERGVAVWSATQRPARIPINLLTESEVKIVFRLSHPDDRKRMAEFAIPALGSRVDGHDFMYYRDGDTRVYRTRLSKSQAS